MTVIPVHFLVKFEPETQIIAWEMSNGQRYTSPSFSLSLKIVFHQNFKHKNGNTNVCDNFW